ncbi:MAG: hypothetical protein ABIP58_03555 [Dehalococcoidia bacterium]
MKTLVIAAIVVGALAFVGTGNKANAGSTDSAWENRVAQVDGYLNEGLTSSTHEKIAGSARDGADVVVGFGDRLNSFVP